MQSTCNTHKRARTHTHTHIHHTHTHTHTHAHTHTNTHIHTHKHTHKHTHTHTHTRKRAHAPKHERACTPTPACTRTHTRLCTSTPIHARAIHTHGCRAYRRSEQNKRQRRPLLPESSAGRPGPARRLFWPVRPWQCMYCLSGLPHLTTYEESSTLQARKRRLITSVAQKLVHTIQLRLARGRAKDSFYQQQRIRALLVALHWFFYNICDH